MLFTQEELEDLERGDTPRKPRMVCTQQARSPYDEQCNNSVVIDSLAADCYVRDLPGSYRISMALGMFPEDLVNEPSAGDALVNTLVKQALREQPGLHLKMSARPGEDYLLELSEECHQRMEKVLPKVPGLAEILHLIQMKPGLAISGRLMGVKLAQVMLGAGGKMKLIFYDLPSLVSIEMRMLRRSLGSWECLAFPFEVVAPGENGSTHYEYLGLRSALSSLETALDKSVKDKKTGFYATVTETSSVHQRTVILTLGKAGGTRCFVSEQVSQAEMEAEMVRRF